LLERQHGFPEGYPIQPLAGRAVPDLVGGDNKFALPPKPSGRIREQV